MSIEILKLTERINIAREIGESHFREFKSGLGGPFEAKQARSWKEIAQDIGDTLVGFANSDGGELIVGLEDDGSVTGVHNTPGHIDNLIKAPIERVHKDTPLPIHRAIKIEYEGKMLLYFVVPKGTEYIYITSDGRCLQRKDLETVPVSSEHITFSRIEQISREYDRQFVDRATLNDLDIQLVSTVAEQISKGMSVEKCLQHIGLAEFDGNQLKIRKAALLLFAKDPNKWHPRLQVRVLVIKGSELLTGEKYNVASDQEVTRNLIELVENSWELLRPHLVETKFSEDAIFRTQIIYPELACREALINAIAHRDYSAEGRGIEIKVFSDRLGVTSPGGLLSSIQLKDLIELKGVHQSRNSLISRVLRELGYMRELGEGIKRIYDLMNRNDLQAPEIHSDQAAFSITLHHKYVYSSEVKLWIDSFKDFNLSRDEKTVVRLGYGGREISPSDIWDAVGIVDTDYYRQLIESLAQKGVLYRSTSRPKAFSTAKSKRIGKKKVPQFSIKTPIEIRALIKKTEPIDEATYAKIFVGNVPYDATEEELTNIFNKFGEVVNVNIPVDYLSGYGRGFAFIEFQENEGAIKTLNAKEKIYLHSRTLYIQEYQPRSH